MKKFSGKTVIVTGGNSGIGRATAIQFAEAGAQVAIIGRNPETGQAVVDEIREQGGIASFHRADIADKEDVDQAFSDILASYGRFHAAFNNAGISNEENFFNETEFDEFDQIVQNNLYGTYYCMKQEIRHYLEHGGGSIVNCSSISALVARKKQSAYAASKSGILGLTRVVALEYANQNIRVNAVCPGGVMTPAAEKLLADHPDVAKVIARQHPVGHMANPREIGNLVLWLSSDEATNVIGQSFPIDGGYTIQ